jgi:hypothetical protein
MTRQPSSATKPAKLWTVRMIHEDLGVPMATAETIFHRVAIDYDALVRPPGIRRRFVTLAGYDQWRITAGLEPVQSGGRS